MSLSNKAPDSAQADSTQELQGGIDTGDTAPRPAVEVPGGQKPDLLEYLAGLEGVKIADFKSMPETKETSQSAPAQEEAREAEEEAVEEKEAQQEPVEEKSKEQLEEEALAEKIRASSKATKILPFAALKAEDSNTGQVMRRIFGQEEYGDILHVDGQKDTYYYSDRHITANYAMVAVLVAEKDLAHTVSTMVRYNCKTYPAPTAQSYFMDYPYMYTKPQMERVRDVFKRDERYSDIKEVTTGNDKIYFYSEPLMTEGYAKSLAEDAEYGEHGYK